MFLIHRVLNEIQIKIVNGRLKVIYLLLYYVPEQLHTPPCSLHEMQDSIPDLVKSNFPVHQQNNRLRNLYKENIILRYEKKSVFLKKVKKIFFQSRKKITLNRYLLLVPFMCDEKLK